MVVDTTKRNASFETLPVTSVGKQATFRLCVEPRVRPEAIYQRRQGGTKWLESAECCDDSEPVFVLQGDIPQPPIVVNLQLQVEFELDTGAAVSVMAENTFNRLFPEQQLQRSSVRLKTYTGAKMHTLGALAGDSRGAFGKPQEGPAEVEGTWYLCKEEQVCILQIKCSVFGSSY